jgi:hypothetical protein
VYGSLTKLLVPILPGAELLTTLGLILLFRRARNRASLALLSSVVVLAWILQELVDALYSHTVKDILFLAGVPAATVQSVHPPILAAEFVYPPNDLFYEATGVLKLVPMYFLAILLYRLVGEWRSNRGASARPQRVPARTAVAATLGIALVIVGVTLLLAYVATHRVSILVPSLLTSGLGVLALAMATAWLVQARPAGRRRSAPLTP